MNQISTSERRTEKKLQDCFSCSPSCKRRAREFRKFTSRARRHYDKAVVRGGLLEVEAFREASRVEDEVRDRLLRFDLDMIAYE